MREDLVGELREELGAFTPDPTFDLRQEAADRIEYLEMVHADALNGYRELRRERDKLKNSERWMKSALVFYALEWKVDAIDLDPGEEEEFEMLQPTEELLSDRGAIAEEALVLCE